MSARLKDVAIAQPAPTSATAERTRPRLQLARASQDDQPGTEPGRGPRRWLTLPRVLLVAIGALLYWGASFPTEQYLTPGGGVGYALGIAGGSSMLLLLVYPLRKRLGWLKVIGTTKRWFQAHMVLGVVGPVLVLFHSNFTLGATNSNVALACMLVVSGSGLFGRYFYGRIHHGLYGRKATLAELKDYAQKLRWVTTSVQFLPELISRLEAEERRITVTSELTPLLARPFVGTFSVLAARRRLRRHVGRSLETTSLATNTDSRRRHELHRTACDYIDARLDAIRRVVTFAAFERLFSLWHALHLPLFLMLLVAGVVHVFAVHVY